MDSKTTIDEITNSLIADLANCKKMLLLLKQETEALANHNIELLEATIDEKSQLILEFNENQDRRNGLQIQLGVTHGFPGLKQLLDKDELQSSQQLANIIQDLQSTLNELQKLNIINGKIVHTSMSQNQRVIDVLYGKETHSYGADAQAVSSSSGSCISRA